MSEKFHIRSKGTLSVFRSINNVATYVRMARDYGIDPKELLAGSGIEINELDDPHRIITTAQEIVVGRRLAHLVPPTLKGLDVGQNLHLISKGKLGMAAMCCDTALDALKLLFTYVDLTSSSLQFDLTLKGKMAYLRLIELLNRKNYPSYILEAEIISIHTICAMIMDDVNIFKELHLAYPAPVHAARYKEMYHCPVFFDEPENIIVFDATVLNKPLKHANPLTRKVLEEECRHLCKRLNESVNIKDKIRHELLFIDADIPTLDQLAQRINMPERTIRRKLAAEGSSYKDIVCEIRKQKSMELIQTTDFSMEKIAEILGYSDVTSFYHAFKAWTGTTPASYRKKASY